MFAGAAREAVFANPQIARRVQQDFIPVALKAGLVNNPPPGAEGDLYAEVARSKPAPQGICVANSAGKVLDWVLMFDDDASVGRFLDHALARYRDFPDATKGVPAERFMRYPSRKLADVADTTGPPTLPDGHGDQRCLGKPALAEGTLVGRIIGRALDSSGKPFRDTRRQEHYLEARLQVPVQIQEQFIAALARAGGKPFAVPDTVVEALVTHAYLGQLDVNPLGRQPGGRNDHAHWDFRAIPVADGDRSSQRLRLEGQSRVAGGADRVGRQQDGRHWEHQVDLAWEGYLDIDLRQQRITRLLAVAEGNEKLRWGNLQWDLEDEADVAHLPAGHAIDLTCAVRYGIVAEPCAEDEIGEPPTDRPNAAVASRMQRKMRRLQAAVRQRQNSGGDLTEVGLLTSRLEPLLKQRKFAEAEALLDEVLQRLEARRD